MLHAFLDGLAVLLIVSLIAALWFAWQSGSFRKDKDD